MRTNNTPEIGNGFRLVAGLRHRQRPLLGFHNKFPQHPQAELRTSILRDISRYADKNAGIARSAYASCVVC